MRKKLLYVLAASAFFLIIFVGARYSISLQDKVASEQNTIVGNQKDFSEENLSIEKPKSDEKAVTSLPRYVGQSIMTFGNDSIINQFPESIVEKQRTYLANLNTALQKNPYDFDSWMQVGIHKKFFNNYEGARDAWEYAKLLAPEQQLSYLNLANLYAYYLRDFAKAEVNYIAATERDFNNISGAYTAFATFYRDFGVPDAALEWYQRALEFSPKDPALLTEIERLENVQ